MKYTFNISILVFAVFLLSCGYKNKTKSESKKPIADDYSAKIDSLILTTNPRKFNGIVLITQDGETRYSKEYGFSDFEKKTPISLNDNFRIQSNSKQITAVLILKEVEKGNIDLKKSISEYLPNFEQKWADSVTVEQLLNMSAGIEAIDKPLLFKPETGFHYSNPAYGLLGEIIKNVTGRKYANIANHLFEELKMKNTYCYELNKVNKGLINGYWFFGDKIEKVNFNDFNFTTDSWETFLPAGGIISNLHDLTIWDKKLHNGGILKPETYKLMVNSKVVDSDYTFSDQDSNYGYGVNINERAPSKYIGHAGRGFGFVNLKFYIPNSKIDIIILENVYTRDVEPSIVYHFEKEIRKIVLNSNLVKE